MSGVDTGKFIHYNAPFAIEPSVVGGHHILKVGLNSEEWLAATRSLPAAKRWIELELEQLKLLEEDSKGLIDSSHKS